MFELGGVRDGSELMRRLVVTALALLVYRLGSHVTLPGLEPQMLAQINVGSEAAQRLSVLALGIGPFVTVLILAELIKVVVPPFRAWESADLRHHGKLNRILVSLALIAAAAQASGLALALEDVKGLVAEPGTAFRLTCIATLVAGTALLIWLADIITRDGIGSGVWLLLLVPLLAGLPEHVAALAAWLGDGNLIATALLIGVAFTALLLAGYVWLLRADGGAPQSAQTSLWSVLLAKAAWPWIIILVAVAAGAGTLAEPWLSPAHPFSLIVLAGLVALFVGLYERSQRLAGADAGAVPARVMACVLAALTLAEMLAATRGLAPLAGHLVLIAVVALAILKRWWMPPWTAHKEAGASDEAR